MPAIQEHKGTTQRPAQHSATKKGLNYSPSSVKVGGAEGGGEKGRKMNCGRFNHFLGTDAWIMVRLSFTRTMGRRAAKGRNANHGSHMFHMRGNPSPHGFPKPCLNKPPVSWKQAHPKNLRPMPRGENSNGNNTEE